MSSLRTDPEAESKLYRSISEVADLVGVKQHVLRYWETQFSMLRPRKNRAGNRMYRPDEIKLLLRSRELLYDRRYTIACARRALLDERREAAPQVEIGFDDAERRLVLHEVKTELKQLAERLKERRS